MFLILCMSVSVFPPSAMKFLSLSLSLCLFVRSTVPSYRHNIR